MERIFTQRERIGNLLYREGPSSIEDEKALVGERERDTEAPLGLNENLLPARELNGCLVSTAGSEVLMIYFAKIGRSEIENTVDVNFIETLLDSGADVNYEDANGQTVMHEVALWWPTGLADFFLQRGADIDNRDSFGRTPLHVAAAVNAPDMVKWLIKNGADIHANTTGEKQAPIHYAAKNNSIDVIPVLLELGSRLGDRDYKERTPLSLAAETGREDAARILLEFNAPAGVWDDTGTCCLTYMIDTMPDVAAKAIEQFYYVNKATRTSYYYLSYLESKKWEINHESSEKGTRFQPTLDPLEQIIRCREERLIMHPVIQRLILKKRELYGTKQFYTRLLINLIFTLIWTALTAEMPKGKPTGEFAKIIYEPIADKLYRVVLEIIGLSMAVYFSITIYWESNASFEAFNKYQLTRISETIRDYQYCHPRWPHETNYVTEKVNMYRNQKPGSLYDTWFYLECASFIGLFAVTLTRMLCFFDLGHDVELAHYIVTCFELMVLWFRLMKYFRPFIALGPFITMLGYVFADTLKFGFLFVEFYIPYACAVWLIFGGPDRTTKFTTFSRTLFEVFQMTIVDSFNYEELTKINKLAAQLICGTYFALVSITCLNLYIALLSDTFSTILGNATATAYMLQGEVLISCEKKMKWEDLDVLKKYLADKCSPEVVVHEGEPEDEGAALREIKSDINTLKRQVDFLRKKQANSRIQLQKVKKEICEILERQKELNEKFAGISGLPRVITKEEESNDLFLADKFSTFLFNPT